MIRGKRYQLFSFCWTFIHCYITCLHTLLHYMSTYTATLHVFIHCYITCLHTLLHYMSTHTATLHVYIHCYITCALSTYFATFNHYGIHVQLTIEWVRAWIEEYYQAKIKCFLNKIGTINGCKWHKYKRNLYDKILLDYNA